VRQPWVGWLGGYGPSCNSPTLLVY
jgi:hypothetical protein